MNVIFSEISSFFPFPFHSRFRPGNMLSPFANSLGKNHFAIKAKATREKEKRFRYE